MGAENQKKCFYLASDEDVALEALLCTEVPLVVLDTLELVMRVISVPASDLLFFVLPSVLRILVSFHFLYILSLK